MAHEAVLQELLAMVGGQDHDRLLGQPRLVERRDEAAQLVVASPDTVPMSATGKVDKSALQELLRARGVRCGGASPLSSR